MTGPHGEGQSKRWAWVNWSRLSRFDSAGELHRVPDDEINSIAKSAGLPEVGRKVHGGNPGHGGTTTRWWCQSLACLLESESTDDTLVLPPFLPLSLSLSLCCKLHGYTKPRATLPSSVFLALGEKCSWVWMHPNNRMSRSKIERRFFSFSIFLVRLEIRYKRFNTIRSWDLIVKLEKNGGRVW